MNNFENYLLTSAVEIKKEIKNVLLKWRAFVEDQTPSLKKINDLFIENFEGGKYIRGTLVKLGYELSSPPNHPNLSNSPYLKVAAAFEILHTSLLIHDDIFDKSLIRRGKPTIHSIFKNYHYGVSQAICLGDVGFFLATKIISASNLNADLKNKIIPYFSQVALETILGEMLDVKTAHEKLKKEKDILATHKLKTAQYTISGPLSIGAMIGKANEKQLEAIKKFGEYLGMSYQIQDDILGVFGDEKIIGKSITSDIEENKNTLLISHALKKATPAQKKFLKKYYGSKKITKKQLNKIKNIFVESGSLNYSQKKAKKYILEAKNTIPSVTRDLDYQKLLFQFSDFIVARQK